MTKVQVSSQTGSQLCCADVSILINPVVLSEGPVFPRHLWYKPGVLKNKKDIKIQMKVSAFS